MRIRYNPYLDETDIDDYLNYYCITKRLTVMRYQQMVIFGELDILQELAVEGEVVIEQ